MELRVLADHMAGMAIQIRTSLAEPDTGEAFVPHRPARPDKAEGGRPFVLSSEDSAARRDHDRDLLGVTEAALKAGTKQGASGSRVGQDFTMAR